MSFMREHEIGLSPLNRESNNQEMRRREEEEVEREGDKVEHESRLRLFSLCLTFSFHQVSLGIGARFQLLRLQPGRVSPTVARERIFSYPAHAACGRLFLSPTFAFLPTGEEMRKS